MEVSIPIEAEYQNLIRRGFRIIRLCKDPPYGIEMKKEGERGWRRIEIFDTHKQMINRYLEMLNNEKTLQDTI